MLDFLGILTKKTSSVHIYRMFDGL